MTKSENRSSLNRTKIFGDLRALVMLQLKDKIDFTFLKSKRKTLFKLIYSILLFAVVTLAIYAVFTLVIGLGIFSFLKTLNFRAFLVLMTILLTLSFVSCLINVTKTLYFSKDNPVLLTMPATNGKIFMSKLIVCFIYELIRNISYILPFLIAYGLCMGLPIVYYLWSIFSIVFITIVSVSLSGLLSIPSMLIAQLIKRNKIIEFVLVAGVLVALTMGIVYVINLIPSDIDLVRDWGKIYWDIQGFLKTFSQKFFIFDYFVQLISGMSYNAMNFNLFSTGNAITFGICLLIILVCVAGIILLSKPLFLKMVSSPFEFRKKENKFQRKNHKHGHLLSATLQQTKREMRTPSLIYSVLLVAILTPVAIFLQNKVIGAMDTKILGDFMGIAFNILIILLMMLSSNVTISSIYSSEGNSAYINKIVPVLFGIPLTGKLILNAGICIISIIVSTILINVFANIGTLQTIMLSLSLIFVFLAHLYWSAEMDVMNPQNQQYQTTGKSQKNPNETKSTIFAFITSFVFAFISFFLMKEDIRVVFIKLLFLSLIFCVIRIYLFYMKVNLYYKEK